MLAYSFPDYSNTIRFLRDTEALGDNAGMAGSEAWA